ncbi:MAG TPA: hypothetical protein VMV58_04310 [Desulfosporosinus sp.]|nr:hypothetical protein [Desulfosporosinus sp.]
MNNEFGTGITIIFEVATPFQWKPSYYKDLTAPMHRVMWLWFAVAFLPTGYVEHRCLLLEAAWRKGFETASTPKNDDDDE